MHDDVESGVHVKLFPGGSIWRNTSRLAKKNIRHIEGPNEPGSTGVLTAPSFHAW